MDEIICQIGAHLKRRSPRRAPSLPAALFQTVSLGAPEKKSSGKLDRRAGARAGRQLRRARLFINQFNLLLKSSYLLLLSARPASAVCCLSRRALAISGAPLLSWRASERARAIQSSDQPAEATAYLAPLAASRVALAGRGALSKPGGG